MTEGRQSVSSNRTAYTIVVGNEKGGSGKTTTAAHLITALLRTGFRVASLDLDPRQRSLTRFFDNRRRWTETHGVELPSPTHRAIQRSDADSHTQAIREERQRLTSAMAEFRGYHDFIVIDCPGSDMSLARLGHAFADTLITPINDSFLDLDLLAELDPTGGRVEAVGVYANMVMEIRRQRIESKRPGMDWILMRNRLSSLGDRNKRLLADTLAELSRTFGLRLATGFGERIIFRQLFLSGLTVLDLGQSDVGINMTMSHVAARQEIRQLLGALWLPRVDDRLKAL